MLIYKDFSFKTDQRGKHCKKECKKAGNIFDNSPLHQTYPIRFIFGTERTAHSLSLFFLQNIFCINAENIRILFINVFFLKRKTV